MQGTSGNLGGDTVDVNIRWSGAIRGRAGIAADNLLFYVAGGLAAAGGELAITDVAALPVTTADDVLLGWTLGGGVEMAFDENWVGDWTTATAIMVRSTVSSTGSTTVLWR